MFQVLNIGLENIVQRLMLSALFLDEIWFKKTLRDLVEKHFCTASPDWLDSHAASKQMRAIFEENSRYEVKIS